MLNKDKSEVVEMLNVLIQSGESMGKNKTIIRGVDNSSYKWVLESAIAIIKEAMLEEAMLEAKLNSSSLYGKSVYEME